MNKSINLLEEEIKQLVEKVKILENTNQNLRDENKKIIDQHNKDIQTQQSGWIQLYKTTWEEIDDAAYNLFRVLHLRKLSKLVQINEDATNS